MTWGDGAFDNDADIDTARLNEIADHAARLERKGICTHGHIKGGRADGLTSSLSSQTWQRI